MINFCAFASGEQVWVVTNSGGDGFAKSATELGTVNPCSTIPFYVDVHIPPDYVMVGKFEWFVNGVSVKTTTEPSDPILNWLVQSNSISVYCKVTYKKLNGDLSSSNTSTTFSPAVKVLDFYDITTSTPAPNYGCSGGTVSYSLVETPCNGSGFPCNGYYNVSGNYNITWQAPAGWVQTSLANNGSNVSFTPDATSAGALIATIHLPGCTYTETRTFTITRGAQPPVFTKSTFRGCNGSSTNISINPICGASNYTYSVVGNPNVKFTSNGLQTLTTTSTTVSLSLNGGASVNALRAKANYPNSVSSTETNGNLSVSQGFPSMGGTYFSNGQEHPLHFYLGDPDDYNSVCNYANDSTKMIIDNASSVTWTLISSNPQQVTYSQKNNDLKFYLWSINQVAVFEITASNGCGSLSNDFGFKSKNCSAGGGGGGGGGGCPQFTVAPNPASGTLNVVVPNIPAPCDPPPVSSVPLAQKTVSHSITQIKIYDNSGNLKKSKSVNKAKQASVDLTGLKAGVYLVEIYDGTYKENQQVIIQ